MSESPEHEFLKHAFNRVLTDFARLRLYGLVETDRRRFDVSTIIERDWSQVLVGQVLWNHSAGIEKDVRTLLADPESQIKVYVGRDRVQHHTAVADALADFRRSGRYPDLFKFKTFWIPSDFDADRERDRQLVSQLLASRVVEDLLFNVIFGDLSRHDLRSLVLQTISPELTLAILHEFVTSGFDFTAALARRFESGTATIRARRLLLQGIGAIYEPLNETVFRVTTKWRVMLEIIARVATALRTNDMPPELSFILAKLGCEPLSFDEVEADRDVFSHSTFVELVRAIRKAEERWGILFSAREYGFRRNE